MENGIGRFYDFLSENMIIGKYVVQHILLTIVNIIMIVDHTDSMIAPLCPHVDDR